MMFNYPFFSFPHFRRSSPYYSSYNPSNLKTTVNKFPQPTGSYSSTFYNNNPYKIATTKNSNYNTFATKNQHINIDSHGIGNANKGYSSNQQVTQKEPPSKVTTNNNFLSNLFKQECREDEKPLFEIFGLNLYHDDILLICLIFFLYKEDVKDQYLLFVLVLLLLS